MIHGAGSVPLQIVAQRDEIRYMQVRVHDPQFVKLRLGKSSGLGSPFYYSGIYEL